MQFTHTLKNGKILNVLCLDFIRQRVVVDTLAGLMLIGISRKRKPKGRFFYVVNQRILVI